MANSNSLNINLDRNMVITRLKEKRVSLEHEYLDTAKLEYAYKEAMEAYNNAVIDAILKGLKDGKGNVDDVDAYSCSTRIRVNFAVDIKKPERSNKSYYKSSDRLKSQMDEIDRMIDLLEMCSDATIKSKQYGNIIDFLS